MGKLNLDLFADVAFQTLPDGTRVFFPYGALTRGHVVTSEDIYQRLFVIQKWWSIVTLVVAVSLGAFEIPWQMQLPILLPMNVLQYFHTRGITRELPLSPVRFTMKDLHKSFPKLPTLSPVAMVILLIVAVIALIMGLAVFVLDPGIWPTGLVYLSISIAIVFFCVRSGVENKTHAS